MQSVPIVRPIPGALVAATVAVTIPASSESGSSMIAAEGHVRLVPDAGRQEADGLIRDLDIVDNAAALNGFRLHCGHFPRKVPIAGDIDCGFHRHLIGPVE